MAWMRGTKPNISDEVAIQNEEYIPAVPRHVSQPGFGAASNDRKSSILKFRSPPSPLPPPIDPREPMSMASPCRRCKAKQVPCQRRSEWNACIPCHLRKERCSLTPITRAQLQAQRNLAALEATDTLKHDGSTNTRLENMRQGIERLITGQETMLQSIDTLISGVKHLREDINTRMGEEQASKKRKTS